MNVRDMRPFAAAAAALLLACAGPSSSTGGGDRGGSPPVNTLPDGATGSGVPQVAGIVTETREVRLSTSPEPRYGVPSKHALAPGESALLARVGGKALRHEPGLSRMARELARTAPDRFHMPSALIEGLMAWSGLVEPPPRLAVVEVPGAACADAPAAEGCADAIESLGAEIGALLPEQGDGWVGVGIAAIPGGSRLIVAITERTVQLDPIAAEVAVGGGIDVRGRLLGGRKAPRVETVDARGKWAPATVRAGKGGEFSTRLVCGAEGPMRVEVLADGPHGPEVAANFPVHCGVQAPRSIDVTVESVAAGVDVEAIERANFDALNYARQQRGLPALAWDNAAARVARAHSRDMAEHGFLGHRSPTTGEVADRFRKASIVTSHLRENVARGYGPRTMHDALMNSPGHRINMLADDVTRVGIGAVIGPPESKSEEAPRPIFLTQNFYAPPGAGTPADPVGALRDEVGRARRGASLREIAWDEVLQKIAQQMADEVVAGRPEGAKKAMDAGLAASSFQKVESQQVIAGDFKALVGLDLWRDPKLGRCGIGVASFREGPRAGSLVLVVLTGS